MRYTSTALLASIWLCTVRANPPSYSIPSALPAAPRLTYLYTAYVECAKAIFNTEGPRGIRTTIPIVGGNFTGRRLSGKILDVGADWGVTDVQTGIFSADTRYNFETHDGANIFLQTSGPAAQGGDLHLRLLFETGDKDYYWLNNVVAIGLLSPVSQSASGFLLRIDAWHMSSDSNSTTFVNGTTYP